MPSPRPEILEAYRVAARKILYPNQFRGTSNKGPTSTEDVVDDCAAATEQLLKRQAHCLIELHQNEMDGDLEDPPVDEKLLKTRLDDLATICMSKFYSYRFDQVPYHWRHFYTDTMILKTHYVAINSLFADDDLKEPAMTSVVEHLDRALITAGGAGKLLGAKWIREMLDLLETHWAKQEEERPSKRQKPDVSPDDTFPTVEPFGRPKLSPERTCPQHVDWTMEMFEDYMNDSRKELRPIVLTDLTQHWPAMTDHPWNSPKYLLSKTFGGRRLVPVEVGRSYVDEGWGQELIPFKDFLARYISSGFRTSPNSSPQVGYLAQHNLFDQVPSLRNDIQVPDFCWASVPPHPTMPSQNQPPLDMPQLNAWFGPARTITPLHTDGYHNLLCQVVGTKYVRLYPPSAGDKLCPRGSEDGVDMSNTSAVDMGVLEGWDETPEGDEERVESTREELRGVEYWECVLRPGDTLVIPIGWWHYVRSLSVSFSVSFWWN